MKFAVFGAGVIGQLRAQTILSSEATELTGVADIDEGQAAKAAGASGAKTVKDYRELLEGDLCDAAIISGPIHLHEEMALAAFDAGKHVLCEKPLSTSVESCRRMLDRAEEAGRTLGVGFNMRYYPSFKFLKEVVDEGRIGRLDQVRVFGGHDGLANFRADWMYKGDICGGGAMMDVGIHMTDLARHVAGEITEVYGVAGGNIWKVPASEDRALAIFKTESGVPITYEATWNEWKGYAALVEAYGDKGMVRAYYAPMQNVLITQDRPGGARTRVTKRYLGTILREKLRGWQTTTLLTFEEELADFLEMIEGKTVTLADGWSGFRAIEIANAVYESSTSGQPVTLSTGGSGAVPTA